MDVVRQPHRKTKKQKRGRTTPGSFFLFFHGSPPTLAINSDIYLLVSFPFCRLQNFYLLLSPPSWRSHPPNPPLLHEPASDLITASLPSFYPSVSASPPTIRCSALEPSPPRWAGLGNAGGFSLSVFSLSLSLSACRPQWLAAAEASCVYISAPPQHCAVLPPILALSSSHSLSLTAPTPFLYFPLLPSTLCSSENPLSSLSSFALLPVTLFFTSHLPGRQSEPVLLILC